MTELIIFTGKKTSEKEDMLREYAQCGYSIISSRLEVIKVIEDLMGDVIASQVMFIEDDILLEDGVADLPYALLNYKEWVGKAKQDSEIHDMCLSKNCTLTDLVDASSKEFKYFTTGMTVNPNKLVDSIFNLIREISITALPNHLARCMERKFETEDKVVIDADLLPEEEFHLTEFLKEERYTFSLYNPSCLTNVRKRKNLEGFNLS